MAKVCNTLITSSNLVGTSASPENHGWFSGLFLMPEKSDIYDIMIDNLIKTGSTTKNRNNENNTGTTFKNVTTKMNPG